MFSIPKLLVIRLQKINELYGEFPQNWLHYIQEPIDDLHIRILRIIHSNNRCRSDTYSHIHRGGSRLVVAQAGGLKRIKKVKEHEIKRTEE